MSVPQPPGRFPVIISAGPPGTAAPPARPSASNFSHGADELMERDDAVDVYVASPKREGISVVTDDEFRERPGRPKGASAVQKSRWAI